MTAENKANAEEAAQAPKPFENGSVWVRADFHLHTKADKEFAYEGKETDFVSEYVKRLKAANIGLGVITNHNKFDMGVEGVVGVFEIVGASKNTDAPVSVQEALHLRAQRGTRRRPLADRDRNGLRGLVSFEALHKEPKYRFYMRL